MDQRTGNPPSRFGTVALGSLIAVSLSYLLVYCTGSTEGQSTECTEDTQCAKDWVCYKTTCHKLCAQSRDCAATERCSADGMCMDMAEIACKVPSDCKTDMLDHPECFEPDCVNNECAYPVKPDVACEAAYCRDGINYGPRKCGEDGKCTGNATVASCQGFACDAAGAACRSTCSGDPDCVEGYRCGASSLCVTDLGVAGEACDASNPCVPTARCVTNVCKSVAGQACSQNQLCQSGICAAGTCASGPHGLGESCDETSDCGDPLVCEGQKCRKNLGSACDLDVNCSTNECECDDSACTSRTCAAADCVCGYGTSGSCSADMDGVQDPQDCDVSGTICSGGHCQAR